MKNEKNDLEIKGLCGYVSPHGEYIPCEPWCHMDTATQILETIGDEHITHNGYKDERYLTEELGYVQFVSRGCLFKIRNYSGERRTLTAEQRAFLEDNIKYAKNVEQSKSIEFVLSVDEDMKNDNILSLVEANIVANNLDSANYDHINKFYKTIGG